MCFHELLQQEELDEKQKDDVIKTAVTAVMET